MTSQSTSTKTNQNENENNKSKQTNDHNESGKSNESIEKTNATDSKSNNNVEEEIVNISLVKEAQDFKDVGNKFFNQSNFEEAIEYYTKAINLLVPEKRTIKIPNNNRLRSRKFANNEENKNNNENSEKEKEKEKENVGGETNNKELNGKEKEKEKEKHEEKENKKEEIEEKEEEEEIEQSSFEEDDEAKPRSSLKILEGYKEYAAVYYCNRGACYSSQNKWFKASFDCSRAIECNPKYAKAFLRRAKANEELQRLPAALEDYKKAYEIDSNLAIAKDAVRRLEPKVKEQQEREKEEALGKLKELGNSFLGLFGLSTDNFKMQQDPKTGNYSINFQK